jgi:mRNA-degrading endonuclease RelE of RelBE toxin-antitoxin system
MERKKQMVLKQAMSQLAISKRFFDAYSKLPTQAQSHMQDCMTKLLQNPAHPSLNYEAIHTAQDSRMRSIRVTDQYRAIVAHPDGSGTYILLWVDKHDAAYTWTARHRLETEDEAGGLTIVELAERQKEVPVSPLPVANENPPACGLLDHCSDEHLRHVGVPESALALLRACRTEDALQLALEQLPPEVANHVLDLWVGDAPAVPVLQPELASSEEQASSEQMPTSLPLEQAHADPLERALQRPGTARRFVVLTSEEELKRALEAPLDLWRVFLHPDQRAIVRAQHDGPALVSGGAGTGKTVVGLHRARYLAAEVFTQPTDRILFTTFTHNLALNLGGLMDKLCGTDQATRQRIEIVNVHSLAASLLRRVGESFTLLDEPTSHRLMSAAVRSHDTLGLSPAFYLAEWTEVVQEREALTEAAYVEVDRAGRGKALSRRQRAAIWPVLAAYGQSVTDSKQEEWPSLFRRLRQMLASGQLRLPCHYRAVIVDEAQDMGTPEMRLLLALVGQGPNSVLLLGDTRQQIYARGSFVSLMGLPISRRHHRLRLNYRTTEQICTAASSLLTTAAALNGEALPAQDSISLLKGPQPVIRVFSSPASEQAAVVEGIKEALAGMRAEEIVLIARSNALLTTYAARLQVAGIASSKIEARTSGGVGVQLATMHRVKGLEFRAAFLVGCSAEGFSLLSSGHDETERAEQEERERRLLYVAMTRARELLWISYSGKQNPYLAQVLS